MALHRLSRSAALGLALAALAALPQAAFAYGQTGSETSDKTIYVNPSTGQAVPPPPSSIAASAADEYQDLRSPDARDAALASEQAPTEEQGFPGLADEARQASASVPSQDLRSPDARDAAAGRGSFNSPEVTVVKLAQPSASPDGGLDWADAGIGAAALLGLLLLGLGGTLAVMHRRQGLRRQAATTG
jgi:hypothetical protein